MIFQKIIKNSINNNDYFRIRKTHNNLNRNDNYSPGNLNHLKKNNQNLYYRNNDNFDKWLLSNNISAQNNIAKYKQNIINREKIVEQNYRYFNKYKNNYYNHLKNIKKNNVNHNPSTDDSKFIYKKDGNRLYKSNSSNNIFKNYFYLSDQLKNNINNNYNNIKPIKYYINNPAKYFNKRRTDITDNSIIEINNNKQGFVDYYNKIVEVQNENIKTSEEKKNMKEKNLFKSRLKESNNIEMENKYFNKLATLDLLWKNNSKLNYKSLLDEQVKNNLNDKLMNESLTYHDLVQYKKNIPKKDMLNDRDFLNVNNFVEINPYKQRNYYLGNSFLKKDVINNPQSLFKINKYFFPRNDIDEINY